MRWRAFANSSFAEIHLLTEVEEVLSDTSSGLLVQVLLSIFLFTVCIACVIAPMCLCSAYNRHYRAQLRTARVTSQGIQFQMQSNEQAREHNQNEERARAELDQLPTQRWDEETDLSREMYQQECGICLDEYSQGQEVTILPCKHVFHRTCIDDWFNSRRHSLATCPLCKSKPFTEIMSEVMLSSGGNRNVERESRGERASRGEHADNSEEAGQRSENSVNATSSSWSWNISSIFGFNATSQSTLAENLEAIPTTSSRVALEDFARSSPTQEEAVSANPSQHLGN